MTNAGHSAWSTPDYVGASVRPSPNFGERRGTVAPSILVLHYTGMDSGPAAEDWLCATESEVSSHYLVHEDGRIVQMVPEAKRAWHAGASFWRGITDVNSASIGIEIVNAGHESGLPEFPDSQVSALVALCRDVVRRHTIDLRDIVGHSDIAPGRKRDPGERFPWRRLAEAGLGLHVPAEPIAGGRFFAMGDQGEPVAALQSLLGVYGFDSEADGVFGKSTHDQVTAFQRRHRPERVDGVADASTIATLHRLLSLYSGIA